MPEAFYELDRGQFVPTELTRGPWDPGFQHGGPPAALLGRAIERFEPQTDMQVARISFDIFRAVPIAPLSVRCELTRPGRSVQLIEAWMSDDKGTVMRATAWRIRRAPIEVDDKGARRPPPPPPAQGSPAPFFSTGSDTGYHSAMEWQFVAGSFLDRGPATVWLRMRHPLIANERPSPLCRVLIAADSGNGVSAVLDYQRYMFINPDLAVYLHRLPAGEWVCLEAMTVAEGHGVGFADTALYDDSGAIGRAVQSLLLDRR